MERDYIISIAMATYNGEKYIKEQIDSILHQIKENDEIIISDDGSKDQTIEIIKSYKDKRIKIINGPKQGIKQNFANAIKNCSGKYIFLSDQDDIWMSDKLETVLKKFEETNCACIIHDNEVFDSDTEEIMYKSFFEYRNSGKGIIKNIWKNTYIGCCMAFKQEMVKYVIPIPSDIEMHDQWIGILCEKHGNSVFIEDKLIRYRRHGKNASEMNHHPLKKMIKNRLIFIKRIVGR